MQPEAQLSVILPTVCDVVGRIQGMQMNDPTPCADFTVHDVLNHMIVGGTTFAHHFRGEDPPEISPPGVYGWVPLKEFRAAMDDLLDSVSSPGAMERTIPSPVGDLPGETFARFVAVDGLIHGWDLSTATGQPYEVDEDLVLEVEEFARAAITPEVRETGMFAAETPAPADATPLERLVAFSGRSL